MLNFSFNGKATRKEFWYTVFAMVGTLILYIILVDATFPQVDITSTRSIMDHNGPVSLALGVAVVAYWLIQLVTFILRSAVAVRRCNDAGINGNWVWLTFIDLAVPGAGWLVLLVIGCLPTKQDTVEVIDTRIEPLV